jgi:hypothetical protein
MAALAALALGFPATPLRAEAEPEPLAQEALAELVAQGRMREAFGLAFETGDAIMKARFTLARGVGANIGENKRFSRFPRADLTGPEEWANHFPRRFGGANASSCVACHAVPFGNGAGDIAVNAFTDPGHTGDPSLFLERNTLPLFALGVPQRLAEEISLTLYALRDRAVEEACETGSATAELNAKGVDYGTLRITRTAALPCETETDASGLKGIDADLVIKPFGWKGIAPALRTFARIAAHNELGLQADELVAGEDGDFDGVTGELTVGDITAMTVYMAALERPVSLLELDALRLIPALEAERKSQIQFGEMRFAEIGCADCHVPAMPLEDPVFSEPSSTPGFFDAAFPDGSMPAAAGVSPATAIRFDLTVDQPGNQVNVESGSYHLGALEPGPEAAVARWFTDFRRHDMGPELADPVDTLHIGASMFLTRSLAGVGSTGPWLHDGRATTLEEAILAHGGAASDSRDAFVALPPEAQDELVAFLENLVIFKAETGDE